MPKIIFIAVIVLATLVFTSCNNNQPAATNQQDMEAEIEQLLKALTLEEKIDMIHGHSAFATIAIERLGIPALVLSDGPHGVRQETKNDYSSAGWCDDAGTYLPTGVALAATWNPEMGYQFGRVLGSEANYRKKDVILGPGINIARTPLNGRNFEYMSEDPCLNANMVVREIIGIQEQGVAACVKHFVANNQEWERHTINVEMEERALREIYLPGFEAAVKEAGVYTIMTAYNRFRGQFCAHNAYLVNDILKGEWGFDGVNISDWGATHDTYEAGVNGLDLEFGTEFTTGDYKNFGKFFMADALLEMVKTGKVGEDAIDDKVRRILRLMKRIHMFDKRPEGSYNTKQHQETARQIAREGIVLLKNQDSKLPLAKEKIESIAVIGDNAMRKHAAFGGSSQIKALYEISPWEGIKSRFVYEDDLSIAQGYDIFPNGRNQKLFKEAVELAKAKKEIIFIGGSFHGYSQEFLDNAYDCEFYDKPDMKLPFGQDALIDAIASVNPNVTVVLVGGGPVEMPWLDKVKAVVQAWYPGMEGGHAIAEILFGDVNPSGKLPITFPKRLADSPAHAIGEYPGQDGTVTYKEGLLVGYRYFDTKAVAPLFEFGFGLSYTTFEISDMALSADQITAHDSLTVTVRLKNTGKREGAEVVQAYVQDEESTLFRPFKELKAFKKVVLQPGEETQVSFVLDKKAFSYFNDQTMKWEVEPGVFHILVGNSAKNIVQKASCRIN